MSLIILCLSILERSVRLALTVRDRIPLRSGGLSGDDEDCCSFEEYLVGSNVTTPPDCAPLIIVTLTCIGYDVGMPNYGYDDTFIVVAKERDA